MREYVRGAFLLAAFTLASVHVLAWNDKISDMVYSAVVIATIGAFITGEALGKGKA